MGWDGICVYDGWILISIQEGAAALNALVRDVRR